MQRLTRRVSVNRTNRRRGCSPCDPESPTGGDYNMCKTHTLTSALTSTTSLL